MNNYIDYECPIQSNANLLPIPVPISQSTSNLENSKLLKAVPIGNGLYRLEEPDQGMAQVMSRESVYQAAAPTGNLDEGKKIISANCGCSLIIRADL